MSLPSRSQANLPLVEPSFADDLLQIERVGKTSNSDVIATPLLEAANNSILRSEIDCTPIQPFLNDTASKTNVGAKSITTAVTLELCCGTAGLSAEMHALGCDALGIDFTRNPSKPKSAILIADLSDIQGQSLVLDIVANANVEAVHAGPPCGTASKAREKRIDKRLLEQGAPAPRQLRSNSHPCGLPGLTANERLRVDQANRIYQFVGVLFLQLHLAGIIWTLENPLTSYFWLFPAILTLLAQEGVFLVKFQQCCHGGTRPVWRQWATNLKGLMVLTAKCDGKHMHDSFQIARSSAGVWAFSTAQEAAYPKLLCMRTARIIHDELVDNRNYIAMPTSISEADLHPESKRQKRRAVVGLFVRGNKLPQHIAEFSITAQVQLQGVRSIGSTVKLPSYDMEAKILRQISGVIDGSSNTSCEQLLDYQVGVFRSPLQFLEEAKKLRHPIDMDSTLPDILKRNVFWILTNSHLSIAKFRLNQIQALRTLVANTAALDEKLFAGLSDNMKFVLEGKRLSALRLILQRADYPDIQIIDDIVAGLALTGPLPISGVYPRKLRSASITAAQLKCGAKWTRKGLIARVKSSGDLEVDARVWSEALEEKEKGWLSGPFSEAELITKFGGEFVASRRFGLSQGPKVRSIDDFSESLVNSSVSTFEKIELMGVDDFVAMIKLMAESIGSDGRVSVSLTNNEIIRGTLPAGVSASEAKNWVGKTFDLKSAFRQLATKEEEQWASVIAVFCPMDQEAKLFVQHALPFGSVGSVFGFNRASRALWAALAFWLRTAATCFYDDYPVAEPAGSSNTCELAIRSFFMILGWNLSLDEKKDKRFASKFDMLGVTMDMSSLPADLLAVDNKPERVLAVSALIDSALLMTRCPAPLTGEIRGKCQYSANQFFGRVALGPLHQMAVHQYRCHSGISGQAFKTALLDFKRMLNAGIPRQLSFTGEKRPILFFSDGACEGVDRNEVTVGAVCFDTVDNSSLMFGAAVPNKVVAFWKSGGNVQTIGQAELLPVLLGRIAFREKMRHRRCFIFIDNDGARHGLIKGYSDSFSSELIIRQLIGLELEAQSWVWYARVPSCSNPADGPSRLRLVPGPENLFSSLVETPEVPAAIFPTTV